MSYAHEKHYKWIENNVGYKCSDLGKNVANILGYVGRGIYNAPIKYENIDWANHRYIKVNWEGSMSNFDGQALTDLVLYCHHKMIRVTISPSNFRLLKLEFWQREQRDGCISKRLPTIQTQLEEFNLAFGIVEAEK